MSWRECTVVSQRRDLVERAIDGEGLSGLCRSHEVSRKTAYKWLARYRAGGLPGLEDLSRRPNHSPLQTLAAIEEMVCELRQQHPAWGGRKLHHRLLQDGILGVPAPSTINGILGRHGLLSAERRLKRDTQRFEAEKPNELWQMDFKGHIATREGRCHPLTVCDDHSRFNICLIACPDERHETVQIGLTQSFREYGLPERILADNGPPWGNRHGEQPYTQFSAWLIRLGVSLRHGRPRHPQTQGKEERFHRTLLLEVLSRRQDWLDNVEVQLEMTDWRVVYNFRRPHEALGYQTPSQRYQPSSRPFPEKLPEICYEAGDQVRKVQDKGEIFFKNRVWRVGHAFKGQPVALRASADGQWDIYYCRERIGTLDLTVVPKSEM